MQQLTLEDLIKAHEVEVDEHLDRQLQVPVSSGLQRQGDVIVIPATGAHGWGHGTLVPAEGIAVVRGEAGGNTHLLLADGPCTWGAPLQNTLDLGVLNVADGATAYLAHPEHGFAGIAPGTYVLRRQREQADEIRMVAD